MDYQGVLGRFTYDDGTDIQNRISAVESQTAGDRGIDRCHLFIKGDQNPVTGTDG